MADDEKLTNLSREVAELRREVQELKSALITIREMIEERGQH